jgi:DNA-binding MarR family transcriptional regulator
MTRRNAGRGESPPPDLRQVADAWSEQVPGLDIEALLLVTTLQRLAQDLERSFVRICRRYKLGPGDVRILLALRRSLPTHALSPSELFRDLLITSGAVTKQVDRLVDAGLVTKQPDPLVFRGLLVTLQPQGLRIADEVIEAICSYPWLGHLTKSQKQQALSELDSIVGAMEREPNSGEPAAEES